MNRDDVKNQVQQATDLVRLIGEQVALRPKGKEFLGLCPFHDDKNPSMHVSPAKQIYKCFSCGAGGDAFAFVMSYHKMTFPEAIKYLAERAGIKIEERPRSPRSGTREEEPEGPTERQLIGQANTVGVSFFQAMLRHATHGQFARDYVAKRNINPEMVEAFQIGYAPDRWDGLALTAFDKKWDAHALELAGLITARTSDQSSNPKSEIRNPTSYYDRFRHRLMFPICDAIGRPIAFGGRKLRPDDEPKYLNSPEHKLFNKSATLYGLHLAKKAIIDSRTAVIVEGYTDVIACHQAGVKNVVATLGTALTSQHVAELRRYCDKVVLIYDADEAGIKAADRAVEVFLTQDVDVAIAVLPDELDPADLLEQADGLARWQASMTAATDALTYQFQRVREQLEKADTVTGRQRLVEDYLRRLAHIGLAKPALGTAAVRRSMVLQRLAELLHLSDSVIADMLNRLVPAPFRRAGEQTSGGRDEQEGGQSDQIGITSSEIPAQTLASGLSQHRIKALQLAERQVIGGLLQRPGYFHDVVIDGVTLDEALPPSDMISADGRRLYEWLYDHLAEGRSVTLASLLADLAQAGAPELAELATLADAEMEAAAEQDAERMQQMMHGAAASLLAYHRDRQYRQEAESADLGALDQGPLQPAGAPTVQPRTEQMLRQVSEHGRIPSPRRFPGVRR
ncbi:MAG: DNA primase [Phycisphaeraceae bacterium]